MIVQMQKRARGISRVGRRLFPNLHTTGLPPAWFQLLGDPITALDGLLASVTSVATPDSEENSTGTMSDSPPPHTFRQPQQSLAPSQIARGGTGLPPAWFQLLGDPIPALDRGLASVTSVPTPDSEGNSTGTMSDSPPPHTFRQPQQSLDRGLASARSVPTPDSEENSTGTMSDSPPPHTFRQPQQSPAPSHIARVGSRLFPDLGGTDLAPAWPQVLSDPITALDPLLASVTVQTPASETRTKSTRDETAAPPNLFAFDTETSLPSAGHRQSASPTALLPADISPAFRSSGVRIFGLPKPNFAAAGRSSSPLKDQSGRTKLVPFSRLAEMLHPGGPADESRTDPQSLVPTEAEQTAPAGSYPSSQAVTVEAVLEQLEQRLQFEFLRMYGSSGE